MKISRFFTFLLAVSTVLLLVSCEKEITVKIPKPDPTIVVEGYIETGTAPYVILTNDIPYFDKLNLQQLSNLFIKGATVKVVSGVDTVQLTEFSQKIPSGTEGDSIEFVVYTDNPFVPQMPGQNGKSYQLLIETKDGKKLSATTTIPLPVEIDSLTFERADSTNTFFSVDSIIKIKGHRLLAYFTDPVGQNYYRVLTSRQSQDITNYIEGDNSIFSLELFDGKPVPGIWLQGARADADSLPTFPEYFRLGDTVGLKWCAIDRAQYDFWETYESNRNGSGPFSPPVYIKTNIKGGLGVWAGTGVKYYTTFPQNGQLLIVK